MGTKADKLFWQEGETYLPEYQSNIVTPDNFVGCSQMIENYALGFILRIEDTEYRVFSVLALLLISKE